jgi:hypothetical protein
LRDQLWGQIKWFDNPQSVADYLRNHDWALEYMSEDEETKEFVAKALVALDACV